MRIIEIGCGNGDLLAALQPSEAVGIDFSPEMLKRARERHPKLRFIEADIHDLTLDEQFDVVILSDLVNDLWDVQQTFERAATLVSPGGRLLLNFYSRLWELPLKVGHKFGFATALSEQNWLTPDDIKELLDLEDFEVLRCFHEVLWPVAGWPFTQLFNRFLVKLSPFNYLALSNFMVARLRTPRVSASVAPVVSVIVPARNEAGNIKNIFDRVPEMGGGTELVFVEGGSSDDTYQRIEQEIALHPDRRCRLFRQTGKGKGDAVRLGFSEASGDILMILDADLTVPPEDLPRFYEALVSGKGDFINGVRLVYPMEQEAMRFLNLLGNKFFSLAFTWLLEQPIKDTLCGTKVLWKRDYLKIAANRAYFGEIDPFGDFDLLFGAAKLNMKIIQIPIRYRERVYGETNISRFSHGALLLKMVMLAARRIKFV